MLLSVSSVPLEVCVKYTPRMFWAHRLGKNKSISEIVVLHLLSISHHSLSPYLCFFFFPPGEKVSHSVALVFDQSDSAVLTEPGPKT